MPASRSGLLVAWATAWLDGRAAYDDVVTRVTGDDEPHRVRGLPGCGDEPVPLGWALPVLRQSAGAGLRLVLPAPGDVRGVPAAGEFAAAALAAGEALVTHRLGLVPAVTRHGSPVGSAATCVLWTAYPIDPPPPDPLPVADAEYDLGTALREATSELARLDVARWRPELAGAIEGLRRPPADVGLPPGHDPRAVRLLATADRLAGVLALAAVDAPGAAVDGAGARGRAEALRRLEGAVRRARLAAYNGVRPPEADRRTG